MNKLQMTHNARKAYIAGCALVLLMKRYAAIAPIAIIISDSMTLSFLRVGVGHENSLYLEILPKFIYDAINFGKTSKEVFGKTKKPSSAISRLGFWPERSVLVSLRLLS
jgi:hypothetical protein